MDNLKVVAQIAKRQQSQVERVTGQTKASSVVSRLAPRTQQLRRKSLFIEENSQCRLTRMQIQDSFEKLRASPFFDYGDKMFWTMQNQVWDLHTPWLDGQTLVETADHEKNHLSTQEPARIRAKIKLWVRFFERLGQWHGMGVLHGNLKPGNLLVCENLTADVAASMTSEFFQKSDAVPHVAFLDGGYMHHLQHAGAQTQLSPADRHQAALSPPAQMSQSTVTRWSDTFWFAPEISGAVEGSYTEAADVFSLAAIMAWDFGMLANERVRVSGGTASGGESRGVASSDKTRLHEHDGTSTNTGTSNTTGSAPSQAHYAVQYLWPVLCTGSKKDNTLYFGQQWIQWSKKHPVVEMVRKLRSLLARALSPLPEKRMAKAREIAFELMIMANRLGEIKDENSGEPATTSLPEPTQRDWQDTLDANRKILLRSLELPDALTGILETWPAHGASRYWLVARNANSNAHIILRRVAAGLHAVARPSHYFRVRHADRSLPFATLNRFLTGLVGEACRRNAQACLGVQGIFASFSQQAHFFLQVLPSLKVYFESANRSPEKLQELAIQARHETLHNSLDKLLTRLLQVAGTEVIVIDDLHRADPSSLAVLLRALQGSEPIHWVLGTRETENTSDLTQGETMRRLCEGDPRLDVLANQRNLTWITKLNALKPDAARMLAAWTTLPSPLCLDVLETLAGRLEQIKGLLDGNFHAGKTSEAPAVPPAVIHDDDELIGQTESTGPIGQFGKSAAGTSQGAGNGANTQSERPAGSSTSATRTRQDSSSKDFLGLVCETIRLARSLGILVENRDLSTGRVMNLHWASERVALSLSLLLGRDIKSALAFHMSSRLSENMISDDALWSEIVQVGELFIECSMAECGHAAFASLVRAAELVTDLYATTYLIQRFQCLEERLERQRSPDADSLIPRIREHIGDLSLALGKLEVASKYYSSVGWNLVNPKRRSILALKSFMPSQLASRESRLAWFEKIIQEAEYSELLPQSEKIDGIDSNLLATLELRRVRQLLSTNSTLRGGQAPAQSLSDLVSLSMTSNDTLAERLPYQPRSRSIREMTMAHFLRTSLGWIDSENLIPHLIRTLHLSIDQEDGQAIVHTLFTLLLCGERQIRADVRTLIIESIQEVASRTSNDLALAEALLLKAWVATFFDGKPADARRALESLNSGSNDLPASIRLCCNKLTIMLEFETYALEEIQGLERQAGHLQLRLRELGLARWDLGMSLFGGGQRRITLRSHPEEVLVSCILSEKTDQILLYSYHCIEGGQAHAAATVASEVRDSRGREWFSDKARHLELLPESVARSWKSRSSAVTRDDKEEHFKTLSLENASQAYGIDVRELSLFKQKKSMRFDLQKLLLGRTRTAGFPTGFEHRAPVQRKPQPFDEDLRSELRREEQAVAAKVLTHWQGDEALDNGLRFDRASNPDPEKIAGLAQAMVITGYLWTAHRLCAKAGLSLAQILHELQNEGITLAVPPPRHAQGVGLLFGASVQGLYQTKGNSIERGARNERTPGFMASPMLNHPFSTGGASPELATVLNYVLEFIHNLQRETLLPGDSFRAIDPHILAQCLLKSIPIQTDPTEAAIAEALKAAVRRMGLASELAVIRNDGLDDHRKTG